MPRVGSETSTPVFERAKTVHDSDQQIHEQVRTVTPHYSRSFILHEIILY
jgi:hypothetical protein